MKFKRKSALNIDPNDEKSSVVGNAVAATMKTDAFSNPGARTGFGEMNLINTTEYPLTRLSQNWSLLTSLYRSSWIVQRVCSIIPEDAMTDLRIEAPGLDNDSLDKLDECISKTKIRRQIIEAIKWARLYGGAAAVIMIDGQDEDLLKPLRVNDILPGSFRGLFIVDRWSGIYPSLELVSNPASHDYGLPRFYEVRDEDGVLKYRIHHSRILRFIGTQMPYYESLAEQQWGTSAVEAMYDDLVRRDNVTHNIANLTFKACLSVYEIDSLDQIFASASASAQRRMYSMIEAMSILESNLGVRLVNKGDAVQQLQYSFGGLPEVLDGAMLDVSGSTAIPATRLFGRSPAGMNSTGESDEKNYRSTLEQQRSIHIYPALEKLAPIVSMSALGGVPAGLKFKLPPLD
jgi:phage-related protein (TIGR01555 family)